jgi:hypothetical protein
MAGLTNRSSVLSQVAAAPSSILRSVAVGVDDTVHSVSRRFGVDPMTAVAFNKVPVGIPMGEQGVVSLQLLCAPIPPFVSMTSPVPPGTPDPYGTGWLGAVSIVQGQYAGQPLSTNM